MYTTEYLNPSAIVSYELTMSDIKGLLTELAELKAESAKLTEWASWGKYSAK